MNREELVELIKLKVEMIAPDRPNRTGKIITPQKITVHNTSNKRAGADANAHSSFVRNRGFYWIKRADGSRKKNWVSWHYTVDDRIAIKHLPLNEQAIHAGKQANMKSIAIEICMHEGIDQKAADEKAAQLVALLCHDLSLGVEDVVTHQSWTGKNCPALLIKKWSAFISRVSFHFENITEYDTKNVHLALEDPETGKAPTEGMCWEAEMDLVSGRYDKPSFMVAVDSDEINLESVYSDISDRINDEEIMEEIRSTYDFSKKNRFWDSFIDRRPAASLVKLGPDEPSSYNKISDLPTGEQAFLVTETIVLEHGRPSLLIKNGQYEQPKSITWKNRLRNGVVSQNIPSVGRIELRDHHSLNWVGTGWLVKGTNLIVTNRHVAKVFGRTHDGDFIFKNNFQGKKVKTSIDFKEEHQIDEERYFRIDDILHMADDHEPDIAILKVSSQNIDSISLPGGLEISREKPSEGALVYTLGYPARDSRFKNFALMDKVFKGIYNVKRLAPGRITKNENYENLCFHDCSTLNGSSGSPVISLETGKVIGLHFAGTYLKYNWAVESRYLYKIVRQFI